MAKILILDTYYPDLLKTFTPDPNATYEEELHRLLSMQFGTADFYSRNLRKLEWQAEDVIGNWNEPRRFTKLDHDVVFCQDLHLVDKLHDKGKYLLAGQLSCPWPGDERVRQFDVLFTSFPAYVKRIEKLGVRAVYNPLAFEPLVLPWHSISTYGDFLAKQTFQNEIVFVGGVGNPSHWTQGMKTLEAVARDLPIGQFKWWGYGLSTLRENSPLRGTYQGEAWGRDMYEILLRSKIVVNRHGEVAEGFANNMRMYEATGCGAMLLTDNQTDLFAADEIVRYSSPDDCVMKAKYYLEHEDERAAIAARGQARTLRDHTYAKRMQTVSQVLTEMLVAA